MAPAGTRMGSGQASVRKPLPAVGRQPGKGRREGRRIWVLGGGQSDALRQFVTLTGTKDKSRFWARSRDCPRSDLNPERTKLNASSRKNYLSPGHSTFIGFEKTALLAQRHFLHKRSCVAPSSTSESTPLSRYVHAKWKEPISKCVKQFYIQGCNSVLSTEKLCK